MVSAMPEERITVAPWSRPSIARRSGRTRTASRATSTTPATRIPPAPQPSARSASSRAARRCSSPPGMGAATALVLALLSPGQHDRARRGRLLRHGRALRRARALGPPPRPLRPDRAAARGRRPGLGRGALEPAPDDARPRGRRRAPGARRLRLDRRDAVHLRPLERGCDLVLHSATKYLAGHHDVLLGAVVCKRADDADRLRELRTRTGIVAAPDAAWLLLRGLKTLERPDRAADGDGDRARAPTPRPSGRRDRPLPGLRRAHLVRRRRRGGGAAVETATRVIVERDEPRRSQLDDGEPPPLGGRPRARGAAAPERRPRARRGALARPRAGARPACHAAPIVKHRPRTGIYGRSGRRSPLELDPCDKEQSSAPSPRCR